MISRRNLLVAGTAASMAPLLMPRPARAEVTHQFGEAWFTNVPLQTHEGRTVRFYDDLMKGKVVMINFMFTECDGICPGMTQNLADMQEMLGDRVGREVFMYSISIDPKTDTPQKLAEYVAPYNIRPGWLFLTGEKANVELLRARLGFVDSDPVQDASKDEHTGTVRIGNEPLHRWVMGAGMSRPEALIRMVNRVIPS
jgi:protein SCO1/2